MPRSFTGIKLAKLAAGFCPSGFPPDVVRVAQRKLLMLQSATELRDLRSPPGNRLEALRGDREGQHSIGINNQWRVCFRWVNGKALDIEVTDYH